MEEWICFDFVVIDSEFVSFKIPTNIDHRAVRNEVFFVRNIFAVRLLPLSVIFIV